MNFPVSRLIICGLLFLFTLIFGIWLTHSGKPYNGILFNIHKLIALASVIMIGINISSLYKAMDPKSFAVILLIILGGLLFLALFVSGALLSIGKPASVIILRVHQVAPLLALGASAVSLYLLAAGQP